MSEFTRDERRAQATLERVAHGTYPEARRTTRVSADVQAEPRADHRDGEADAMTDRMLGGLTSQDVQSSIAGRFVFVQKAFVVSEDRLLLVQKSPADPYYPGLWEVPGGRMKLAEDPDRHIKRETFEETGIRVVPGSLLHIWHWFMPDLDKRQKKFPLLGVTRERRPWVHAIAVARLCRPLGSAISTQHQVSGDHLSQVCWVPVDDIPGLDLIPGIDGAFERFRNMQKNGALTVLSAL